MSTVIVEINLEQPPNLASVQGQFDTLQATLEQIEKYGPTIAAALAQIGGSGLSDLTSQTDTASTALAALQSSGDAAVAALGQLSGGDAAAALAGISAASEAGSSALDGLVGQSDRAEQSLSALGSAGQGADFTTLATTSGDASTSLDSLSSSAGAAETALGTITGGDAAAGFTDLAAAATAADTELHNEADAAEASGHAHAHAAELSGVLSGALAEQGVHLGEVTERFNQLREGLAQVGSAEESTSHGFDLLGAGLVGLATVAIGKATEGFVELGDAAHETAEKTGASIPLVQGLGYAFQTIGESAGAADRPLMLLERQTGALTDQLDKGQAPTGKFAAALDKLGISAQSFVAMNPDQRIRAIFDAFSGKAEEINKTQVAMDLFGRSGASMIGIMEKGSAIIDTGISKVSQYGASVENSWPSIERFHTAQANLSTAVQGFEVQLGGAVLPALSALTDKAAEGVGIFDQLPAPIRETATVAGLLAVGVTGAAVAFDLLGTRAIASLGSLKTFLATNPEMLIAIEVVGGLALGYEFLKQKIDGAHSAKKQFDGEVESSKDLVATFVQRLMGEGTPKATVIELARQQIGFLTQDLQTHTGQLQGWELTLRSLQGAHGDHAAAIATATERVQTYTAAVADDQGRLAGWKAGIDTVTQAERDQAQVHDALAAKTLGLIGPSEALATAHDLVAKAIHTAAAEFTTFASGAQFPTENITAVHALALAAQGADTAFQHALTAETNFFNAPTGQQTAERAQLALLNAELANEEEKLTTLNPKSAEYARLSGDIEQRLKPAVAAQQSWNKSTDDTRTAFAALTTAYQDGVITLDQYNSKTADLEKSLGGLQNPITEDIQKTHDVTVAQQGAAAAAAVLRDKNAEVMRSYREGIDYGVEPFQVALGTAAAASTTDGATIAHASDPIPGVWLANLNQIPGILGGAIADAEGRATTGGNEIGADLGAGVAAGISSWVGAVERSAANLIDQAIAAAKAQAQISSPSKRTHDEVGLPLGDGTMDGWGDGIIRSKGVVLQAFANVIQALPAPPEDAFATKGERAGRAWGEGFQAGAGQAGTFGGAAGGFDPYYGYGAERAGTARGESRRYPGAGFGGAGLTAAEQAYYATFAAGQLSGERGVGETVAHRGGAGLGGTVGTDLAQAAFALTKGADLLQTASGGLAHDVVEPLRQAGVAGQLAGAVERAGRASDEETRRQIGATQDLTTAIEHNTAQLANPTPPAQGAGSGPYTGGAGGSSPYVPPAASPQAGQPWGSAPATTAAYAGGPQIANQGGSADFLHGMNTLVGNFVGGDAMGMLAGAGLVGALGGGGGGGGGHAAPVYAPEGFGGAGGGKSGQASVGTMTVANMTVQNASGTGGGGGSAVGPATGATGAGGASGGTGGSAPATVSVRMDVGSLHNALVWDAQELRQ